MRETGHDYAVDVCLDLVPRFAFFGWAIWKQGTQVAGFDGWEDGSFVDCVVVVGNCDKFSSCLCTQIMFLMIVLSSMAPFAAVRNCDESIAG